MDIEVIGMIIVVLIPIITALLKMEVITLGLVLAEGLSAAIAIAHHAENGLVQGGVLIGGGLLIFGTIIPFVMLFWRDWFKKNKNI